MRTYILFFVFAMYSLVLFGQSQKATADVRIGAIYEIGKPTTHAYKHINFPRPNMVIKRGGIANYKRLKGRIVIVTELQNKKDGSIMVKLKRKDGKRFFGSHPVVTAALHDALESRELLAK